MDNNGVQKLNAFITLDWDQQRVLIKTKNGPGQAWQTYRFEQIKNATFTQQTQTKAKKNLVSKVVLGDLLAGGLGAFAGMMSAGQPYKVVSGMQLVISLQDAPKREERIELISNPLKTSSLAYQKTLKDTQTVLNALAQLGQKDQY